MKVYCTVALVLTIVMSWHEPHGATVALPPPDRPYNILMLLPVSSRSHRNVFMPLATALTERGHKITMLGNREPADNNPRITYINHNLTHIREDEMNMFEIRDDTDKNLEFFSVILPAIAKDLYTVPLVKELYKRKHEFDLIVIDGLFNELAYPFAHQQLFITIATAGLESMQSATLGNIQNPAYFCSLFNDFPIPMTFWQRWSNVLFSIAFPLLWRYQMVIPKIQHEVSKHFPDLPPLLEIERNQSLVLLNSHFSLSTPLPLVPGQIEVGCMHCRPGKPLPKDINDFVSGAVPVVYFSLGSVARGTTMPIEYKKVLLSAFAKLPYKVIWKFEETIDDLPANIMIGKWMPQQDILAHPNVKLFISHCGLLSTQEAMYHGKPVLGLPIFADQPKNAQRLEDHDFGKMLIWEDITEESVMSAIKELVSNPSYQAKISAVSTIFKDQLETPVGRAVFWTEYVIRHSGAVHLRSPERDLSWIEVLHLDILLALHVLIYLIWRGLKKVLKVCLRGTNSGNIKNKRE